MLGYPVITAYYQVSVRFSLTLPSASFSQLLTKLTLPQLMDRSISAHKGLEPSTLTSCPAHIKSTFGKSPIVSKTSINTQQESKEIFRMKILEKADEMYEKIRPKVA